MMIESLHIRNFQTHLEFHLEFDKQITSLTGKTNAGKSSIIRALRWICLNQPDGDDFIHWDADECEGKLIVDGHEIIRKRGKGVNTYSVDGKVLEAFGRGVVPDEIAAILNVSDDNFSMQLDQPYWLLDSPGQVSKNLNSIINLESIDRTLANVASELRKSRAVVAVSQDRLSKAKEQRNRLTWVKSADVELKRLEALETGIEEKREQQQRLTALLERLEEAGQLSEVELPWEQFQRLEKLYDGLIVKRAKGRRLIDLLDKLESMERKVCEAKEAAERAETDMKSQLKGKCPVCLRPMKNPT